MTNKDRKKKVIKWLVIGICCIILLGVLYGVDSIIVGYNQSKTMEYRLSGGVLTNGATDYIHRSVLYYIIFAIGALSSILGLIVSIIMFLVNLINCWVNNTPEVVQQVVETKDPLIQLTNLYNERLLTRQEFEEKKRQLLRGKTK